MAPNAVCNDHIELRMAHNGKHKWCSNCEGCKWCPVIPDMELTRCALEHQPRPVGSRNKNLGVAYKAHIKQLAKCVPSTNDSLPSAECIALHKMYAALDVPARSRRNKPFPANKRDDLRVIQAYRSVCICAGNIMCSGEGEYLLGRVDGKNQKKIPHPKMEIFILDNAKVFLTTTNHDVFKSAFSAVCAICTRSELNALLHTLLQERNSNDNGKYVIEPRLQRWRQRVLLRLDAIGKRQFQSSKLLYAYWRKNGEYPRRTIKCRVQECAVMNLCVAIYNACNLGWRPSAFRTRLVGNKVMSFPYFVRDCDTRDLEKRVYKDVAVLSP